MQLLFYMISALAIGGLVVLQPPLNAILARSVGSSLGATAVQIFVSLNFAVAAYLLSGAGSISRDTLVSVPWWAYLAGLIGAIYVGSGIVIAPVTGALVFFVCIVAGQLVGSTIADHFGILGLEVREVSVWRVLGIVLVLVGAVMVGRG